MTPNAVANGTVDVQEQAATAGPGQAGADPQVVAAGLTYIGDLMP
jgi:hypothetical protein